MNKIQDEGASPADPRPGQIPNFVKVVPFEPEPGEKGMNLDEMIRAGLIEEDETTVQGAYFAVLAFAKAMKERRTRMGLSLTDVSERSGLTRAVISKLENGASMNPTPKTLELYANALDATITIGFEEIEPDES